MIIIRGKALISWVEEHIVLLLHDDIEDLVPLFSCWINTRWILRTGLDQKNLSIIHSLKIFEHTHHVNSFSDGVVVFKAFLLEAAFSDDVVMEGPGHVWSIHLSKLYWVILLDHLETQVKGASSCDSLHASNSVLNEGWMVSSVCKFHGSLFERRDSIWEGVFLVEFHLKKLCLSFLDTLEDDWLSFIISVSAYSKKNFLWAWIIDKVMNESKNWIGRSWLESTPYGFDWLLEWVLWILLKTSNVSWFLWGCKHLILGDGFNIYKIR